MLARLYSNQIEIGSVAFEVVDEDMSVIEGILTPTPQYDQFRSIFHQQLPHDHQEMKRLRLNVQLENGYFLLPYGGFAVEDFLGGTDEIKLRALGVLPRCIQDFFKAAFPAPFLLEPWRPLTVDQKISIEDKLLTLGLDHPLAKAGQFCANGKLAATQHVLFVMREMGGSQRYAIAREGRLQVADEFEFFEDFSQFKMRMRTDKVKCG